MLRFMHFIHIYHSFNFATHVPPVRSTLFPYTTLFRSSDVRDEMDAKAGEIVEVIDDTGNFVGQAFHSDLSEIALRFLTTREDRKSTRLNSSHITISYAVFCLKKKKKE